VKVNAGWIVLNDGSVRGFFSDNPKLRNACRSVENQVKQFFTKLEVGTATRHEAEINDQNQFISDTVC
jgi:hypothetical protein